MQFLITLRQIITAIVDWFYKPFDGIIPHETFKYAATGGSNMLLDIFIYFVSYNFILDKHIVELGFVAISPHIAAMIIAFCVTFPIGFLLAKYITFPESILRGRVQLFRYGVTVAVNLLINYTIIKVLVETLAFYPTISKIFATGVCIAYSYFSQKHFTFKKHPRTNL